MPRCCSLLVLLSALLLSRPSSGDKPQPAEPNTAQSKPAAAGPRFDRERLEAIGPRLEAFVKKNEIPGAVTLVATADRVVHVAAVGQADIAAGRPMQEGTIFRIASMTKPITATALMQLVEAGKLSVDDPVSKHIPSFHGMKTKEGKAARDVTIREILSHTAGLAQPDREDYRQFTLAEIADRIAAKPLEFEPGSKWQYSSGLTVAGRLIEVASGESFAEYVDKHICRPLGMTDTTFRLTADQAKRLAVTYKPGKGAGTPLEAVEIPDPTRTVTPNPSGSLYSTAGDMARFYQAILRGGALGETRIVSADGVRRMLSKETEGLTTGFTPGNFWGLGWCVTEHPQGVTRLLNPGTYGHGGAFGTQGWTDPRRGLILVLMIQRTEFGNSDGSDIRDAFNEAALTAFQGTESSQARFKPFANYKGAIELTREDAKADVKAKAVLCPEVGGRVLSFTVNGVESMFLDERERDWIPGTPGNASAGRFDFGPELIVPAHPEIWAGPWTAEITGESSARLTSDKGAASGIQLVREFELRQNKTGGPIELVCTQTMMNVSRETREVCHWGRSFSPGGGVCLVPLKGQSRFPSRYAMYEDSAIINVRNTDDQIRVREGFLEILSPPRKPKLGFDSQAGALAYVLPGGGLFVKKFAVDPDRVYNEAAGLTLSVWYPAGPRIELEPIGPRERLAPGEGASFAEVWSLHPFPAPRAGEPIDLEAVRKILDR